jgi:trans-2,3-dihydro-3-hydroxyanthranilate isomerase
MQQMAPEFLSIYRPEEVLPIFGLSGADLLQISPIQTVSTGTPQLMIPVRDLDVLRKVVLDVKAYKNLRTRGDFFSPHLFCLQGITSEGSTFARHFGVPPDTPEDPVTGSATGGMAAYLWHYGLIDKPTFIAEQGHWMKRPGQIYVEVVGSQDNIQSVSIGGSAVTIIRGELTLVNKS